MIEQRSAPDRRSADRFPLDREVRYLALTRKGPDEQGVGKTLNMSSKGLLFEASQNLLPGRRIEVSVNWPVQLNNDCPLKLVVKGKIVRAEGNLAAVEIMQTEFRTQSKAKLV